MSKQLEVCKMVLSNEEFEFANANSFDVATDVVLGKMLHKRAYQHYCHLDSVLKIIMQKRWRLSKCSSSKMNDLQEPRKFAGNTNILDRTYIMCFGYGLAESAAMWGLYGKSDPFALRVTILGDVLEKWMKRIEINPISGRNTTGKDRSQVIKSIIAKGENCQSLSREIKGLIFRDVLYASVAHKEETDEYDKKRGNRVSWGRTFYNLQENDCVKDGQFAGFIKDSEWSYEKESRLCIGLKKEIEDEHISIAVPPEVIADMRFTFSPWLNESYKKYIEQLITAALESAGVNLADVKQRFSRSVLHNALNFK